MRMVSAVALAASIVAGCAAAQDISSSTSAPVLPAIASEYDAGDWPLYARDHSGQRYTNLDDINRDTVGSMERAWEFQLRPQGGGALLQGTVPVVIDGIMYMPLGDAVVALEADSGREIWRHPVEGATVRRAVSWWPGNEDHEPRLYYSTGNALVAILAETGELARDFGDDGVAPFEGADYAYPPSVFRDTLVIGAWTPEWEKGPDGDTRAFDAITGEFKWAFNTIPHPGELGHETWLDDGWEDRPGANMWIWYTTADVETNTLYMTLGSPGENYYGGSRPGDNLFANSLVAVDIETGEYKWHFQAIHHELWDWDLPAPPVLVDVEKDGEEIPALALTGKNGLMYILNRHTGEPVHGVNEQLVAAANVPGEWYSPTQPIPVKPEPLNRMWWDPTMVVTAEDTTPEHAAACRALLDSYGGTFFNSGPFTPFFLVKDGEPPRSSINMPHNGGSVWAGSAADPTTGYVYVNITEGGSIGWIEERDPNGSYGGGTDGATQPYDRGSLIGPGAYSGFLASAEIDGKQVRMSCLPPPWGRMVAVDANSGEIAWAVPLGTTPQLPEGKRNTGSNNATGGAMVTAGGLVFIGATNDGIFRAFDSATGEIVWSEQLDYYANSIPISYRGKDGKQYVAVIASGGTGQFLLNDQGLPRNGESLIVWALPD